MRPPPARCSGAYALDDATVARLGFGLLLKFFELEARFPRHAGEAPKAAIDYMAEQVKVVPRLFAEYDWSGRSIKMHRAQVRAALGFRESTVEDATSSSKSTTSAPPWRRYRRRG